MMSAREGNTSNDANESKEPACKGREIFILSCYRDFLNKSSRENNPCKEWAEFKTYVASRYPELDSMNERSIKRKIQKTIKKFRDGKLGVEHLKKIGKYQTMKQEEIDHHEQLIELCMQICEGIQARKEHKRDIVEKEKSDTVTGSQEEENKKIGKRVENEKLKMNLNTDATPEMGINESEGNKAHKDNENKEMNDSGNVDDPSLPKKRKLVLGDDTADEESDSELPITGTVEPITGGTDLKDSEEVAKLNENMNTMLIIFHEKVSNVDGSIKKAFEMVDKVGQQVALSHKRNLVSENMDTYFTLDSSDIESMPNTKESQQLKEPSSNNQGVEHGTSSGILNSLYNELVNSAETLDPSTINDG